MAKEYFFLYLVYGLVFIVMGIFSHHKKEEAVSHLPLIGSLKYLGVFGITHGLSEWVTMVVIADLYTDLYVYLFILKQFLKAISFASLLAFGVTLLPKEIRYKHLINKLPVVMPVVWCGGFILLMVKYGSEYHLASPQYNVILLRYFMGLPGGIVTAIALGLRVRELYKRKLGLIAKKYKHLAYSFLIYGIVDGLVVRQMDFFPANVVNNAAFRQLFGFPIQMVKIVLGIVISVLLIRVIETFSWEQSKKLQLLEQRRIADQERRKLGLEIHDSIIQSIYSAGLKLEYFMKNNRDNSDFELLRDIKGDLGDTISKTREFISATSLQAVELQDLTSSITALVKVFNNNQDVNISLECRTSKLDLGELSVDKSSQIYHIIQEAISNVVKHSKGNTATVSITTEDDYLHIRVIDDGVGIQSDSIGNKQQYGLISMMERAEAVGGTLKLHNLNPGTEVELKVPWEGASYGE